MYGLAVRLLRLEMVLPVMMAQLALPPSHMLYVFPFLPHQSHLQPPQPSKPEPAALPDQLGTLQLMPVFHQPAEKDNSTVLHRRNVSQDEALVITPSVSMMEFAHEKNLVSVQIVSTDEQMTKTSVVS